jgi:membrane protein
MDASVAKGACERHNGSKMKYLRRLARRLASAYFSFCKHEGMLVAGGMSYCLAVSLFPLLLVLVAILGWAFEWTDSGQDAEQRILAAIEQQASSSLSEQLGRALDSVSSHASAGGPVGFVLLVIAAIAIFVQFENALDRIWELESDRTTGWLRWLADRLFARLRALGMLLAATIFIIVTMIASLMWTAYLPRMAPTTVNVVLNLLAFSVIYRFVPTPTVRWSEAIRGGIVAAVLWEVGRAALAWYLVRRSLPSAYGIIGSFLAVMLWAYYATVVVLLGAEYVRAIQKEPRAVDKEDGNGTGQPASSVRSTAAK